MTKAYLIQMAAYNVWANTVVASWLQQINNEQWNAAVVSSFDSIAKTCVHIAGAEKIWLDRWQAKSDIVFMQNEIALNKEAFLTSWQNVSEEVLQFINNIEEDKLMKQFSFSRLNGEELSLQYCQAMLHVLNHSTYHRGQVVTMLRQVGFTQVSSTDMMTYFLNNN
jgi:uncharacterized damage-inducible protein DinB